jgi:hypothetical protein
VATLKEKTLPNPYHLLSRIVHDCDFDRQVVSPHGLKVNMSHVERTVAIDKNHHSIWIRDLCTNGKGQSHTHGAETAAGNHATRLNPSDKLSRHHLVVAHTCAEKHVLFVMDFIFMQVLVDFLDDTLRLDLSFWSWIEAEGLCLLPLQALLEPFFSLLARWCLQQWLQSL